MAFVEAFDVVGLLGELGGDAVSLDVFDFEPDVFFVVGVGLVFFVHGEADFYQQVVLFVGEGLVEVLEAFGGEGFHPLGFGGGNHVDGVVFEEFVVDGQGGVVSFLVAFLVGVDEDGAGVFVVAFFAIVFAAQHVWGVAGDGFFPVNECDNQRDTLGYVGQEEGFFVFRSGVFLQQAVGQCFQGAVVGLVCFFVGIEDFQLRVAAAVEAVGVEPHAVFFSGDGLGGEEVAGGGGNGGLGRKDDPASGEDFF